MPVSLARASWGRVAFYLSDVEGPIGRSLVVHEPAAGDAYEVQDRGRVHQVARLDLVFCTMPGERNHRDRYVEFRDLVAKGEPQIFVHPLHGSYLAAIGDATMALSGDADEVRVSAEVVPIEQPSQVLSPGPGVVAVAGADAVELQVVRATDELAAAGLTSDVPAAALATVQGWADAGEDLDTRTVLVEVASIERRIDNEIARLQLASSYERWALYKRMINLRASVGDAAAGATSATEQLFDLVVQVAQPARVLMARLYGAARADEYTERFLQLNDLRTPAMIPPGTYRAPVAGGA